MRFCRNKQQNNEKSISDASVQYQRLEVNKEAVKMWADKKSIVNYGKVITDRVKKIATQHRCKHIRKKLTLLQAKNIIHYTYMFDSWYHTESSSGILLNRISFVNGKQYTLPKNRTTVSDNTTAKTHPISHFCFLRHSLTRHCTADVTRHCTADV